MILLLLLSITLTEQGSATLEMPLCPLLPKSTEIVLPASYETMDQQDDENVILLSRKVISAYKKLNLGSVHVWQKEELQEAKPFRLNLIPFSDHRSALLQQFSALKAVIWGPDCTSEEGLEKGAAELRANFVELPSLSDEGSKNSPFCQQEILEKQTVLEGKTVRVLYPTSVLPSEKPAPHFLIVPKICRTDYLALTDEEALEIETISRHLFNHFKTLGYQVAHALYKNGKVGITVPHFHKHVIFFKNKDNETWGFIQMIQNILFGSTPLPQKSFIQDRDFFRKSLQP
jgi:diadenosine tetraphosphate (Ap4A) HIT family hydrolase